MPQTKQNDIEQQLNKETFVGVINGPSQILMILYISDLKWVNAWLGKEKDS